MLLDNILLQQFIDNIKNIEDNTIRNSLNLLSVLLQNITAKSVLQYFGIQNKHQLASFLESTSISGSTRKELLNCYNLTEESLIKLHGDSPIQRGSPVNILQLVPRVQSDIQMKETTPPLSLPTTENGELIGIRSDMKIMKESMETINSEVDSIKSLLKLFDENPKKVKRDSLRKRDHDSKIRRSLNKEKVKSKTERSSLDLSLKHSDCGMKILSPGTKTPDSGIRTPDFCVKTPETSLKLQDLNRAKEDMERKKKIDEEKQKKIERERIAKEQAQIEHEKQQERLKIFNDNQLELIGSQLHVLQEWSGLKECSIVFDSNVNDASTNNSEFNELIMNKHNLFFINFDKKGTVFGSFMKDTIDALNEDIMDDNHFIFTLVNKGINESKRWFVKQGKEGGCKLFTQNDCLYQIGNGGIGCFGISKLSLSRSVCCTLSEEYEGISDHSLTGTNLKFFTTKRVVVIQML